MSKLIDTSVDAVGDIVLSRADAEIARIDPSGNITTKGSVNGGYTPALTYKQLLINTQPRQGAYNEIYVKEGAVAVAMCFDDGYTTDKVDIFTYLRDKNIPASFAIPSTFPGTGGKLTWAQIKEMHDYGMEIVAHSATHGSPPASLAEFIAESVTAADTLAATDGTWQATIDAFVQPGTWNTGPYYFDSISKIDNTDAGDQLRSRFVCATAYVIDGVVRQINQIPAVRTMGQLRGTDMAGTSTTLAALKTTLALARGQGGLVACGTHSFNLGTGGWNTLATWKTLIDYMAAERDAGRLEFYTLSAGFSLQHSPGGRRNLVQDGGFAQDAAGNFLAWIPVGGAPTVHAADAPSGLTSVTLGFGTNSMAYEIPAAGLRSVRIRFKAKNDTAGVNSNVNLLIGGLDATFSTTYNSLTHQSGGATSPGPWANVTDAWQTFECMFRPDGRSGGLLVQPYCGGGGGRTGSVRVADFEVYKT